MIRKYSYGVPYDTEAVVGAYEIGMDLPSWLTVEEEGRRFSCLLAEEEQVFGLGEQVRGMNKRGWRYVSWCSDDPYHLETARSLYGAHNFLMITSPDRTVGLFVEDPGRVTFDVGYTRRDRLTIETEGDGTALYLIEGGGPLEVAKMFRQLIGRSYIPPRWAFGYGQSRWSYFSAGEVKAVAEEYRKAGIPLDMIYLDIDYMESYKDFTVNGETFPDLGALAAELKEQGVRLVPIIDAGVKVEEGYPVYEEGVQKGYFCENEDGTPFTGAVWPGWVHFPDVLNPAARAWFGDWYRVLLDRGIEGFWNDMNEPAIFYSRARLDALEGERRDAVAAGKPAREALASLQEPVKQLSNRLEDYRSFWHNTPAGRLRHDKVHNLYGGSMTRAAGEAFVRYAPDKRLLLFSRSSYIGSHRYGGIWTGDNYSWWSHLLLNLKMMPGLNLCGFLYTGADLCGFGGDTTEDLMLRWMALGVFLPLMRNHSAMGTRRQELYRYPESRKAFGEMVKLRYRLLPYLYSEFMKAALRDELYARPLAFLFPEDPMAREVEDQLFIGESIMIAPVYTQNAGGRYVYLPERMKLVRFRTAETWEEEVLDKGHHYIPVALDEVVFFLREGHLVPLSDGGGCVEAVTADRLTLLAFGEGAAYEFYWDDGVGVDYEAPEHFKWLHAGTSGEVFHEYPGD
ncbi:alpha-glucosidase [Pseudoflavonifractor phocaeensis]|uniref:glycoside hydrolase family 31 protein n=1 Tax=Pseudoflavonifractor phocaeensis TaxID=1870988 RepID=UPI001957A0BB|nr:TIM-barrel domain-containing protein [Pseudoflavonifractor phocaeensis]MBM6869487.1 alpha-glucosidase [Pseudoflavonifractor phocaeensis]MBM6938418.1 alpha-glucosidase [Pseudoflavonifractor phocaeensis]